jgi:hypothetical protein
MGLTFEGRLEDQDFDEQRVFGLDCLVGKTESSEKDLMKDNIWQPGV